MNFKISAVLIIFVVFAMSIAEAQIIWNKKIDEKSEDALVLMVKTVLGNNFQVIDENDKEKLYQYLKIKNPELADLKGPKTTKTFYLDFPEWLTKKYQDRVTFPPSAAIDIQERVVKEKPKIPLWKKFSPQIGLGLSNTYTADMAAGRKTETVQSDSPELNIRGGYHFEKYAFSYYPEFSFAKNTAKKTNAFDVEFSNLVSWDIDNRLYTSPIAGLRYSSTSHVYVNSSLTYTTSPDTWYQVMIGGHTQWEFLDRKWATLLLFDYTPICSVMRTGSVGNLSGFGYDFSMTTEFFKHFFLTIAFNYSDAKNTQVELEKYRVNTLIYYPF
jgi:uncharacterized protein (UPF0333 family)